MFQAIARRFALVLALTVFAAPMSRIYAQSATSTPSVVTGSDPQPTGEPDPPPPPPKKTASMIMFLTILSSIGMS
jgi:hypothetical protein